MRCAARSPSSEDSSLLQSQRTSCSPLSSCYNGVMLFMAQLSKAELQTFKQLLMDEQLLPGSGHITWDQMKRYSWAEVVHLLTQHFPGRLAWDVTLDIFQKMNQETMCSLVQQELNSILPTLAPDVFNPRETQLSLEKEEYDELQTYKLHVMEKNCPVWNKSVWPGNQIDFLYQEIPKHKELLLCLFLPRKPQGGQPKTVVIEGSPGIGKTTLARRVMLSWARNEFYPHKFRFAFYFHYQELKQVKEHSFADLLELKGLQSRALVSKILSNPDQLLLLIDDFEEVPAEPFRRPRPDDLSEEWDQKLPGPTLLNSLMCKRMLAEATLLLMVRPISWIRIKPYLQCPSFLTLPGFNRTEVIKYFKMYFRNTGQGDIALDFAIRNAILFSMCQVPVICWLVCCCLNEQMKRSMNLSMACPNVTSVFIWYLSTLLTDRTRNFSNPSDQEQLERLCSIAAQGMWDMKWVFSKDDFEKVMMDEASVHTFLQAHIFQRLEGPEDHYVFTLFVFQEFFAALLYILSFPQRLRSFHFLSHIDIRSLIFLPGRSKNYLANMALFLFGLFNPLCAFTLERSFQCKVTWRNKIKVLKIATRMHEHKLSSPCCGIPQLWHCLCEIREEAFASQTLASYCKAALTLQNYEDFQSSAFCLLNCQELKEMTLTLSKRFFQEWWSGSTDTLLATGIRVTDMSFCWWQSICSVFGTNKDLEVLIVSDSAMEPPFMKVFSTALQHPECRLQKLYLIRVEHSVLHEDLFQVLTENQHLKHLEIHHTKIGQEAMKSLCATLTSPMCLLDCLRLESCEVASPEDWIHLARDLQRNIHLRTLLLRGNSLELFGVHYLSVSHLRKLALENCNLTENSCENIAFSLRHSKMLTHLSLAENALKDEGIKHIWRALEYLMCPLKRLVLRKCAVTSACCQDMILALKNNKSLSSLDLSFNNLRNDGIILLCEALKKTDSNLQVLELERCLFSFISCKALASMIRSHRKLRYLDLSNNDIGLVGIMTLGSAYLGQSLAEKIIM
uniref:NACHT, LRR and PYD domains-containing protein 8 n=1 Tax=Jaculus jaculus TaxID=51337 RepID=UPI001E1B2992|nr:NACHT, LRR and PYD domains-containing protein 8 [Jaculus jaculus]